LLLGDTDLVCPKVGFQHILGSDARMTAKFCSSRTFCLCLFLGFIALLVLRVFDTPIWRDDAFFAIVAKNILHGNGYSITYYNEFSPFNRGISSGPVIILSAVLMIALFGNQYWVPGITQVTLVAVLLVFLLYLIRRLTTLLHWQVQCFFILFAATFTLHDIGFPNEPLLAWHALLGDIPSGLLIIAAFLYIARGRTDITHYWWSGILAGLAGLCKLYSLLGAGVLGGFLVLQMLFDAQQPLKRRISFIIVFGLGVITPLALFELSQIILLGGILPYLKNKLAFIDLAQSQLHHSTLSIIFVLLVLKFWDFEEFVGPIIRPFHYIQDSTLITSGLIMAVLYITALLIALWKLYRERRSIATLPPVQWAAATLSYAALAHLTWLLFIHPHEMPRYALPGILYGCMGLSLGAANYLQNKGTQDRIRLGIRLLVVLFILRFEAMAYFILYTPSPHPLIEESLAAKRQLEAFLAHHPDGRIFSCVNIYEIEYLLPEDGNVILCDQMQDARWSKTPKILLTYYSDSDYVHRMANEHRYDASWVDASGEFSRRIIPDSVRTLCPRNDLFSGTQYFIASCLP